MTPDIAHRVSLMLRNVSAASLPLSRVHGMLAAEMGDACASYGQLRRELARRPDLFVLLEPHAALDEVAWTRETRSAYESALEHAGVDRGMRVALASPPSAAASRSGRAAVLDAPGPAAADGAAAALHQMDTSLVQLWSVSAHDPVVRADIADAIAEMEAVRRTLDGAAHPQRIRQ
jgi:hypothetical protein